MQLNKDEQAAIATIMNADGATTTTAVVDDKSNWTFALLGAGIGYIWTAFNKQDKNMGLFVGAVAGYFISKYTLTK